MDPQHRKIVNEEVGKVMKWFGMLLVVLAIAVRLIRRFPLEVAVRASPGLLEGYSLGPILFWILLIVGVALIYFGFRRQAS
jgi:hypothetical protein